MSLPQSKRRVMGRMDLHDTNHRDATSSPSNRPTTSHPRTQSATTVTPLRRTPGYTPASAGTAATTASGARAKVNLNTIESAASTPPLLKRNPATTPNATSPFLRSNALPSPSSAPSTPSFNGPPVYVASPSATVSRASPFERGNIPANVTVRSNATLSSRYRQRELSADGGMSPPQTSSPLPHSVTLSSIANNASASGSYVSSPPTVASGRASPTRTHARSATVHRLPTAATIHATPAQARMAAIFSPPAEGAIAKTVKALPTSPNGLHVRPSSPSRPASPTHQVSRPPSNLGGGTTLSPFRTSAATSASLPNHRRRSSSSSVSGSDISSVSHARISNPAKLGHSAGMSARVSPAVRPGMIQLPSSQELTPVAALTRQPVRSSDTSSGHTGAFPFEKRSAEEQSTWTLSNATALTSPGLITPSSEASTSTMTSSASAAPPLEYAQLRIERKIADLEITNKSLMAINSGLEVTKHRQQQEIRELRRRLREGRVLSLDSTEGGLASWSGDDYLSDAGSEDDSGLSGELGPLQPREDPELEAAHQRCKSLIDAMLEQARSAILSRVSPDDIGKGVGGMKVLSVGEVHDIQEAERNSGGGVEDGTALDLSIDNIIAGGQGDYSLLTDRSLTTSASSASIQSEQTISQQKPHNSSLDGPRDVTDLVDATSLPSDVNGSNAKSANTTVDSVADSDGMMVNREETPLDLTFPSSLDDSANGDISVD